MGKEKKHTKAVENMDINQARQELATYNQKGVPLLFSAMFYWASMLIMGFFIDSASLLALLYLYGTGLLFPLGLLFSKMMGMELLRSINPLSGLSGILAALPAIMAPLLVYIYLTDPAAMPFTLAIITAGHFFPFAWLYQSKAYLFPSFFIMGASLIGILIWPEVQFILVPILMLLSISGIIIGTKLEKSNVQAKEEIA